MASKKLQIVGAIKTPQADFNQTDETKSDYIKNKPDIDALQSKTDETLETTDKTVVGAINEINSKPHYYSVGLSYTLSGDGKSYLCSGIGTCTDADIVIPSVYNGLPITGIVTQAFENRSSITHITFPDSITSLNSINMCANCTNLVSVTLPKNLTYIYHGAFLNCVSLTKIIMPASVTGLGMSAFEGCTSLTIYFEAEDGTDILFEENWNANNRPVVWGFAGDFISVNEKINKVNDKTVDKLSVIDLGAGSTMYAYPNDHGIIYGNTFETPFGSGEVYNYMPIVAGENVTFEADTENKVVKINASSSLPACTTDNNGQFLCVVDGVATWTTIPDGDEVAY